MLIHWPMIHDVHDVQVCSYPQCAVLPQTLLHLLWKRGRRRRLLLYRVCALELISCSVVAAASQSVREYML